MTVVDIRTGEYTLACDACANEQVVSPIQFGNLTRNRVACNRCRTGRWGSTVASPEKVMYDRYAINAKNRNILFNLTLEEFESILSDTCHYCGGPGIFRSNHSKTQAIRYCGLDRVDSSAEYSVKNCVPCCKVCNRAKSNMPHEDFMAWIERLRGVR